MAICTAELITPPLMSSSEAQFEICPWMETALGEMGVREIPGRQHNPRILEYFTAIRGNVRDDETPWCSAFANWVMQAAGIERTERGNARSWMTWGVGLSMNNPPIGAITVLWRESRRSWKGHVGFYAGTEQGQLVLLGGNQGNQVSLRRYPRNRLLGFRWPSAFPIPARPW